MEGHEWAVKPGWRVVGFSAGYRQILGELVMVNVGGPLVWEGCICSLGLWGVLVVVVCSGHFWSGLGGSSDGAARVMEFDNYWCCGCGGCLGGVCEDLCGPVYCWFSGFRCFVLSLLYYGDMKVEEIRGMAYHGPVNVVVLCLVF